MRMQSSTVGWVLLVTAVVLLIVAAILFKRALHRMRAGGRVRGVIVGSETRGSESGGSHDTYYVPKVRFTARDGRSHTFVSPLGRGKPYANGTEVAVVYDPRHPEDAEIAGFARSWLIPLVLVAVGVFSLLMGFDLVSERLPRP
jgi:hypothetical protein